MPIMVEKYPAVSMPWAIRPPNMVVAANASSKCIGFRSPVAAPKCSSTSSVTWNVRSAESPTAIAMDAERTGGVAEAPGTKAGTERPEFTPWGDRKPGPYVRQMVWVERDTGIAPAHEPGRTTHDERRGTVGGRWRRPGGPAAL